MGAALVRIVKRVPSIATGGVIMAATVLAWGQLYQAGSAPAFERGTAMTRAEPRGAGVMPDPPSLLETPRAQLTPSGDHYASEAAPDCSSVYPRLKVCSQLPHRYVYGSEREALADLKSELATSSLRIQSPRPTTGGPCPGTGQHYNVRDSKSQRDYPASIVCCPCCDDDDVGAPVEDRLCGIVAKNPGCDTRRRAVDASCDE